MEDDKKKRKKNKKKKNKQANEPTESDKFDAKELTADSQNHVQEIESNNGQVLEIEDAPNDTGGHITADGDGHLSNGKEINFAEAEKQHWLDREATLEGKIKELQAEKDVQMQKEAFLEERIKQLMRENNGNSEKEASQNENIKQLHDEKNASMQNEARLKERLTELEKEKDALIQKEGSLEQKIQQLQREMNTQLQKEASLEKEILELKGEKDSWVQTEAGFGAKFNQLVDEASLLNSKLVTLEEKVKQTETERDSWILKENSAKESNASLIIDNTKLRVQVVELELSRESLFKETQELKEFISSLQLQINNLEMDKKLAVDAACAQVEKLMSENSELVEKVNELYAELKQRGVRTEQSPSDGSVPGAITAQSAEVAGSISGASEMIPISDNNRSLEEVMAKDERNGELVNINPGPRAAHSSEVIEIDEIVQIPLDENEVKETTSEVAQNDDDVDVVELTDAPLIGAPFRLISFVARYVSGADLVSKNTGR
ncbi:hypothetical protein C2S53_007253 [Perilla frutescens var. hirtella]|uniref:Uncharacterized protein n=1 Tax=Perilla frutescens var. hirtella TaxID=608512 RepID=A0AAD4JEM5_PERFH|nr:hypothetical protein C2S53_007253 [Perilla frutescens var. hirtella]